MFESATLLLTDIVDSTSLNDVLGDEAMSVYWRRHDELSRELMRKWDGQEIGRTDGFLILFKRAQSAAGFALGYHALLQAIDGRLQARIGIHTGPVSISENNAEDRARGANVYEIDGVALPTAARVMSAALAGRTLMSATAVEGAAGAAWYTHSHGFWKLKGIREPMELFELGASPPPYLSLPDSDKAFRVVSLQGNWTSCVDLPHSLPREADAFIGRSAPLQALAAFVEEGAQIITITGMGGIGKSRLALRFATFTLGEFPGGAWFCDLSLARTHDGLVHAVAQGLGVPLGTTEPVEQLAHAIAGRGRCLVVLDTFEQVATEAEATLGAWARRAPSATFLVTSRAVLGMRGEHVASLEPLASNEACSLFKQRMRDSGSHEETSPQTSDTIAVLVDLLDRLPLAIELAAARTRSLPIGVILKRMDQRFTLLTSRGTRRDRQATMLATLDWSWELLSPIEQATLAQVSIFEGSFTFDAAEFVIHRRPSDGDIWVGDVLQALVEKSLLRRAGERFEITQTVREYAMQKLRLPKLLLDGEAAESHVARRHWIFYAGFESESAGACVAELENLMAACRRAAHARDLRNSVDCLCAAWRGLRMVGPFRAALKLMDECYGSAEMDDVVLIKLHWVRGHVEHLLGQQAQARQHLDIGLRLVATAEIPAWHARLLCASGDQLATAGRIDEARDHLVRCLALLAVADDARVARETHNALGTLSVGEGRLTEARAHYLHALALCQATEDADFRGALFGNLGEVCLMQGEFSQAETYFCEALLLVSKAGHRRWEGNTRCNLGLLHHELGRHVEASRELSVALQIARSVGYLRLEATALCNLGIVSAALDAHQESLDWHTQAVALAESLGDPRAEGQFRIYLGKALVSLRRTAEARQCFTRSEEILRQSRDSISLGLLLCHRSRLDDITGDHGAAVDALAEAARIGREAAVGADSELGRALRAIAATEP